jgi:hypothetical protein
MYTLMLMPLIGCRLMSTADSAWPAAKQCLLELLQSFAAASASTTAERQLLQQLLHFTPACMLDGSSLSGSEVLQILRTLPLPPHYEQGTLLEAAYHTGNIVGCKMTKYTRAQRHSSTGHVNMQSCALVLSSGYRCPNQAGT